VVKDEDVDYDTEEEVQRLEDELLTLRSRDFIFEEEVPQINHEDLDR
jgi:hypothetical protein